MSGLDKPNYICINIFITVSVTAINCATTVFMRIQLREKEYAMLRAIGLMPSSLKHIIVHEITILTTVGLLLGYILSIVSTKILHIAILV